MAKLCFIPETLKKTAERAGFDVRRGTDGRFRATQIGTGALLPNSPFNTAAEAKAALQKVINTGVKDLDAGFSLGVAGEAKSVSPFPPQSQLTPIRDFFARGKLGPGRFLAPMKGYAQAGENLGRGKPYTFIVKPLDNAKRLIGTYIADTPRPGLGLAKGFRTRATGEARNKSYQQAVHDLERKVADLPTDQKELTTLYPEWYSKSEVRETMKVSDLEAVFADRLEQLGAAEDIPFLARMNVLIDDFVRDQQSTLNSKIPKLEREIFEGKAPPELQGVVNALREAAGEPKKLDDILRELELTTDQREALMHVRQVVDNEALSLPNVFRYSTAPRANRAQTAKARGMSPEAVAVAEERMKILRVAYGNEGLDADRIAFMEMPILRQFISAGIYSGKSAERGANKALGKYIAELNKMGSSEVLTRRILSGHLDPHELHPTITAWKHINNLAHRTHFDDHIPRAKEEIDRIAKLGDERLAQALTNYVHEQEGLPAESFVALTNMVRETMKNTGVKMDDRVVEKTINMLTRVSYAATIPFRTALVARNYLQTLFFTAPVIGTKSWGHGLKVATGLGADGKFSAKNLFAAIDEAVKAGAIDPNVIPVHAGTEVFGAGISKASGKLGKAAGKTAFGIEQAFDMGFTLYRSADDWGRAVSFFAGKHRVARNVKRFQETKNLRKFMEDSKVLTFNETIQAEFETLALAGQFGDAGKLIGRELADKTHLLYGNASHPPGWEGVAGRLFGQFGTFPVQYVNFLGQGATRGTKKDRAEFLLSHLALNAAVVKAGEAAFGADLGSWATLGSLTYTGGPYADIALKSMTMMGGSEMERALAWRSLKMNFPSIDNPQSIFVGASYFAGDIQDAFQEDDLIRAFGEGTGVKFIKPREDGPFLARVWDKAFGWIGG